MHTSWDVLSRYFGMWNTGDSSAAAEILHEDWVDHAHPEVSGPDGVRQAVEKIRAAQPGLRFSITAMLGDGDLVAVAGEVGRDGDTAPPSKLMWLIRLEGSRMAEMWTYYAARSSAG
ncbi:MAG TPA: nuclear transport factor 2 family protein [Streptosporangiaceae bacterium]